jgi:hypothetical protein
MDENPINSDNLLEMPSSITQRANRPLFEGGKLRCPHDKQLHDVLSYKRFDMTREFELELNEVLKCMSCGHIFSPALRDSEMDLIREAFHAN